MNPTTQLVEAIEAVILGYTACEYPYKSLSDAQSAILLAIADAVDAEIREDMPHDIGCELENGLDYCTCEAGIVNADRARMRTFTTGLREATK